SGGRRAAGSEFPHRNRVESARPAGGARTGGALGRHAGLHRRSAADRRQRLAVAVTRGARRAARTHRGLRRGRNSHGSADAGSESRRRSRGVETMSTSRRDGGLAVFAAAVVVAALAVFAVVAQEAEIKILSPGDDAYMTGPTLLRARVTPPTAVGGV